VLGSMVLVLVVVSILSACEPCSPPALYGAQILSTASSCVCILAFWPQLYQTWRNRGSGSLSYLYYFIQGGGCVVVVFGSVLVNHDPWPAVLPNSVAAAMQFAILGLGLYHRWLANRPGSQAGGNATVTSTSSDLGAVLLADEVHGPSHVAPRGVLLADDQQPTGSVNGHS